MGRESLANHNQITKKALILNVCACEGFSYMYGGMGVSAPSLRRVYRLSDIASHSLFIFSQLMLHIVMEILDLWEALTTGRVMWRYCGQGHGPGVLLVIRLWRAAVTTETPPISLTLEMLDFNAKGVSNCISLCKEYRIHDM